jgi:co-chaperonin GroES (HSP10)
VNFRPLGDRVLIRPEKPVSTSPKTRGGIHLVEARKPDECGEVVAVGEPSGRIAKTRWPEKSCGHRVSIHRAQTLKRNARDTLDTIDAIDDDSVIATAVTAAVLP